MPRRQFEYDDQVTLRNTLRSDMSAYFHPHHHGGIHPRSLYWRLLGKTSFLYCILRVFASFGWVNWRNVKKYRKAAAAVTERNIGGGKTMVEDYTCWEALMVAPAERSQSLCICSIFILMTSSYTTSSATCLILQNFFRRFDDWSWKSAWFSLCGCWSNDELSSGGCTRYILHHNQRCRDATGKATDV